MDICDFHGEKSADTSRYRDIKKGDDELCGLCGIEFPEELLKWDNEENCLVCEWCKKTGYKRIPLSSKETLDDYFANQNK